MAVTALLVTGAAGGIGRMLRGALAGRYPLIRWSDRAPMAPPGVGEETVIADLSDAAAVEALTAGMDAILHLGGCSTEADWPTIMAANLHGVVNLYEGARKAGTQRVIFASSNHAIGFWRRSDRLDHESPPRPDSRYGLSKAFGEDVAAYYAFKHGIRSLSLRIGSCFERPTNRRMLSTWLSYADFVRLVEVGLTAEFHHEIVYGVSRNTRSWWDNSNAYRLGYDPQDDAERFAPEVEGIVSDIPLDEAFQGGQFCSPEFTGSTDWIRT
ncbi:MAG: NAD(P)-dependent oxidoreductase [Alphaproteobacteria bacterium]|nr:NAD(P)-dependent oxidoreductase [Alphaproteobacteria bacterium]